MRKEDTYHPITPDFFFFPRCFGSIFLILHNLSAFFSIPFYPHMSEAIRFALQHSGHGVHIFIRHLETSTGFRFSFYNICDLALGWLTGVRSLPTQWKIGGERENGKKQKKEQRTRVLMEGMEKKELIWGGKLGGWWGSLVSFPPRVPF